MALTIPAVDDVEQGSTLSGVSRGRGGEIRVDWRGLDLCVKLGKGENSFERHILSKVSGHAVPGEVLALMGPSGAGKTSLMNCLASRTTPTAGDVLFNGRAASAKDKFRVGYVHQQEMLLPSLTPREHLLFQSSVRLSADVSAAKRQRRVNTAIMLLGLTKCQHSVIGDVWSGISKNEKRRLCFATEILTDPAVLFADEPTTGLDSAMAEVIVKYMKALAARGESGSKVTVVATIHQPSSEVFRIFDRLVFVVDGRVGYFGEASRLEAHLADIGHTLPVHTPPAEFMMELCIDPSNPETAAARRKELCDKFERARSARLAQEPAAIDKPVCEDGPVSFVKVGPVRKFLLLTKREMLMKLRSSHEMKATFGRCILFGLLCGLTFLRLDKQQSTIFALNNAFFMAMLMGALNTSMGTSMGIPERLPTLIREQRTGAYSVPGMFFSKMLADLPVDTAICLLWATILYWMIGFSDEFDRFGQFVVALFALTQAATSFGYLGGYLATDSGGAFLVVIGSSMPQMLFGGVFINLNDIPIGFRGLEAISAFRWGYESIMLTIWQDLPEGSIDCEHGLQQCGFRTGNQILDYFGVDTNGNWWRGVIYILIIALAFRVLAFLALVWRARPRQFDGQAPENDAKGEFGRSNETAEGGSDDAEVGTFPITLEWSGLTIEVVKQDTQGSTKVPVLSDCSGSIESGELLAVMGPSGSGKTVLLQALANISELPIADGEVKVNGCAWTQGMRSRSAFMYQDTLFFAGLTVREHLAFQMGLRTGVRIDAARSKRIDDAIVQLGLTSCKGTLIGQIGSGISGGERKRLAFATEMLMDPSLLVVDEPTSGLDSSMARNVVSLMRDMAHGEGGRPKRTIAFTIHQPSKEVFGLFDKLLLLVDGQTAYFGAAQAAQAHFESLGLACPRDVSPVEFMMRCISVDIGEDSQRKAAQANVDKLISALPIVAPTANRLGSEGQPLPAGQVGASTAAQIQALVSREFLLRRRNKLLFKMAIARTILINFVVGLLYWQTDHTDASVQSIQGCITMVTINTFMTAGFGLTQALPQALWPAQREARLGMYSMSAWYWSKIIAELPLDLLLPFLGSTIVYWMAGLRDSVDIWLSFSFTITACSLVGSGFGYMVSMAGRTPAISLGLFMLIVFPLMGFNGFLIPSNAVPVYFKWIEVISPFKSVFAILSTLAWESFGPLDGCDAPDRMRPCVFENGAQVLASFGIDPNEQTANAVVMGLYVVVPRILGAVFATLRAH